MSDTLESALAEASRLGTWVLYSPGALTDEGLQATDGEHFRCFIDTDIVDPRCEATVGGMGNGDTAAEAVAEAVSNVQAEIADAAQ